MVDREIIKNLIEILASFLPSAIGSAGALMWLAGDFSRKIGMFITGVASGHYIGGYVSHTYDIPAEAAMFVMGLFSMSIADSLFRHIEKIDWFDAVRNLIGGIKK